MRAAGQVCIVELGLGHSALQLYFYDGHPRAGSGICSGFLSEKVDTEEHLDGKQPFVSALCVAWAETMLVERDGGSQNISQESGSIWSIHGNITIFESL